MYWLLELWHQIVRPVIVNMLSVVFLLFLAIWNQERIYNWLGGDDDYPIVCIAEPYPGASKDEIYTDFFIINIENDDFYNEELANIIRRNISEGIEIALNPEILLKMKRTERFEVREDEKFNRDKGDISAEPDPIRGSITIKINQIKPRAIMKVIISVRDRPFVDENLSRMADVKVPFVIERGCYRK